jgi:hypothetical protein
VGLERDPLSLMSTTEELLERIVAAPVQKVKNMATGTRQADHVAPFTDKRRLIADSGHGVQILVLPWVLQAHTLSYLTVTVSVKVTLRETETLLHSVAIWLCLSPGLVKDRVPTPDCLPLQVGLHSGTHLPDLQYNACTSSLQHILYP